MYNLSDFEAEILAKDKYPSWLPEKAYYALSKRINFWLTDILGNPKTLPETEYKWKYLIQEAQHYKPYISLFKDDRMLYCWDKINNFSLDDDMDINIWFAEALWHSLPNMYLQPHTEGEAHRWKEETLKHLAAVRDSLSDTPAEMSDFVNFFTRPDQSALSKTYCSEFDEVGRLPYPWQVISLMIETLSSAKYNNSFYGGNVNGGNAKRTYFINSLTCALLQDIEQPCRKLVQIATSVAFDCDITERQIYRTTQNLNPDENHQVVSQPFYVMTNL